MSAILLLNHWHCAIQAFWYKCIDWPARHAKLCTVIFIK